MTIYFSEALDQDSVSVGMGAGDHFRLTLSYRNNWAQDGQCPDGNSSLTAMPRDVYVSGNTAVVVGLENNEKRRASVYWTLINLGITYHFSQAA